MSNVNIICDNCGRWVQGITWVNGMKFCAKCYQETFGASKDWQLLDKDKTIADLEAKLAESEEKNKQLIKALNGEIFINYKIPMENAELKQQLAEKDKEIELNETFYKHEITTARDFAKRRDEYSLKLVEQVRKHTQDKIELLKKVRDICQEKRQEKRDDIFIVDDYDWALVEIQEEIDTLISKIKGESK